MLREINEPQINFDSLPTVPEGKRRVQLLFALAFLIVALVLVVLRNGEFWSEVLGLEELAYKTTSDSIRKNPPHINPTPSRKTVSRQSTSQSSLTHAELSTEAAEPVLGPLQVDVTYSSGLHRTIVARDTGIHIDLKQNPNFPPPTAAESTAPAETGVQVRFSGQTMEVMGHPAEPVYPLLAQQENIQGAVVLQAQVGEDGNVEALKVISGPPMLTGAALEAVKQWHFKPHQEDGKAVPRETRITVNFAISAQ